MLGGCATNPAHHHHARRSDLALVNPANHPEIALPSLRAPPVVCSSLIEETTGASVSTGMSDRVWPFDLANGSPINCD